MVIDEEGLDLSKFHKTEDGRESLIASPTKRIMELDAPLESGTAGAIQVDGPNKKDANLWAGSVIESIVSKIAVDESLNDTLLGTLQNLFSVITSQKKQVGVIGPKQFMIKLKQENGILSI
jgi:hypothetical protein